MKKTLNVLIVEDSEDDTRLLVRELKRGGFDVSHRRVENGVDMEAMLDRQGCDLILCDYTLPHFSGRDALELWRERAPDVPFIYVSGTIGEDAAVEAVKAGAYDCVLKSNLARLVPAADRALHEAELRRLRRQADEDYQRLVDEYQQALERLKDLSGCLTICERCKRIRDNHGKWQEVEEFIHKHSQAQFSHLLCPDCVQWLRELPVMDPTLRG